MRELSVFVDESGDMGGQSDYYLITLLFHDQSDSFLQYNLQYVERTRTSGLSDIQMHLSPLMNAHEEFEGIALAERRRRLILFNQFSKNFPFRYMTLWYHNEGPGSVARLTARMRRDLVSKLFEHLDYLQSFDAVKVYYDNGQPEVTDVLHASIEYALGKQVVIYRDASPKRYRLSQLVDFVCGLELIALKFDNGRQTATDTLFFETRKKLYKNYLKALRKKRLM